jgi:phospholipid transport system substrate-binding protein
VVSISVAAAGPQDAKGFVEVSVGGVLQILNDEKLERDAKEKKLTAVAREIFDIPLMAKLILGRDHWPKLSPENRQEYMELLEHQVLSTFFDKLDLLAGTEASVADAVAAASGRFSVSTEVSFQGERYVMVYKVYSKKQAWRIYDVEIEGISLIRSYGTQYKDFLRNATIDDLLAKLREKSLREPADLQAVER